MFCVLLKIDTTCNPCYLNASRKASSSHRNKTGRRERERKGEENSTQVIY